jgi:hypothetical protein
MYSMWRDSSSLRHKVNRKEVDRRKNEIVMGMKREAMIKKIYREESDEFWRRRLLDELDV